MYVFSRALDERCRFVSFHFSIDRLFVFRKLHLHKSIGKRPNIRDQNIKEKGRKRGKNSYTHINIGIVNYGFAM